MRHAVSFASLCLSVVVLAGTAWAGEVNVAPLGTATQSTTGFGGNPEKAIDGNTSGMWVDGSISHTDTGDPAPWWQVDLGEEYAIARIVLWNRVDCCPERLTNFHVSVLDAALAELWGD